MIVSSHSCAWSLLIWFVLALLCSVLILFVLLRSGMALQLATDIPNHRSLHNVPVPRVGGWGVIPVSLVLMPLADRALWMISACAALLAVMSHFDDRKGLSAKIRFSVHFLVAVSLFVSFPPNPEQWWFMVLLIFGLVWLINLYNFMDGVDGLAGGMACIGFAAYALAAVPADHGLACAAVAIAGASAGFLMFNFHPARIFLGDAGSIPLGFLAGALGYWGWRQQIWAAWFPLMLFAPFIADASVTLLRRVARGEKFWQAHREHYYQRMVQMGTGHARTALSWYVVMALGAGFALFLQHAAVPVQALVIGLWILVLLLCGWRIDRLWMQFNRTKASH